MIVKTGLLFGVVDGCRLNNGRPTPMAGLHGEVGTTACAPGRNPLPRFLASQWRPLQ